MTLSRILENVQKKGKLPAQNMSPPSRDKVAAKPSAPQQPTYLYNNGERKVVDPVVARLKEARRREREQKEQQAREKKGLAATKPPRKPKSTIPLRQGPSKSTKPAGATTSNNGKPSTPVAPTTTSPGRPKPKKMNFNDLMKKASSIDQNKLSISYKAKSRSPESDSTKSKPKAISASVKSGNLQKGTAKASDRPKSHPQTPESRSSSPSSTLAQPKAPLPTRGPSEKLLQKLKGKTKNQAAGTKTSRRDHENEAEDYEEDDDDMDSFIASEDEEVYQQDDYDRDEIWALFNKGRKRSDFQQYDDYDSDDMEATGAEIFEEENKSKRRAEIEDRKELEEEMRRAELKRQRKMQSMKN